MNILRKNYGKARRFHIMELTDDEYDAIKHSLGHAHAMASDKYIAERVNYLKKAANTFDALNDAEKNLYDVTIPQRTSM